VASQWPHRLALAASWRRATSASVRYSRVRTSTFLGRRGVVTVRFSVLGATSLRVVKTVLQAFGRKPPNIIKCDDPAMKRWLRRKQKSSLKPDGSTVVLPK
jgi:hypothetical protein